MVERAREAALFFAPSSSARRVSLSLLSLSLLLTFSCFVSHFFVIEGEERLIFERWPIVLITMLESSSRS